MQSVDAHIARLRDVVAKKGWSMIQLSEVSGIHINTLRKFGKSGWNPRIATVRAIEAALALGVGSASPRKRHARRATAPKANGETTPSICNLS